jgi:hypothetical protein
MTLKLKEEFGMTPSITKLMEDNMAMALELFILALNIMKQVCDVLDGFLSFLVKHEKRMHITCYF